MKKISILILTYFSEHEIVSCLTALCQSQEVGAYTYEIIVLDNNSQDATVDRVRELMSQFEDIRLIENAENIGFARGVNQLAKHASGEYLVILNPDTIASRKDIGILIEYLETHPGVGVVGPRIVDEYGTVQETCGSGISIVSEVFGKLLLSKHVESIPYIKPIKRKMLDMQTPRSVGWVGGACLIIRKSLFENLGGIDNHFFFSYVDMIDLCARVRKKNLDVVYVSNVTIVHTGSKSIPSNRVKALIETYKGGLYYFRKHYGLFMMILIGILYVCISCVKSLISYILFIVKRKHVYKDIARSHMRACAWLLGGASM